MLARFLTIAVSATIGYAIFFGFDHVIAQEDGTTQPSATESDVSLELDRSIIDELFSEKEKFSVLRRKRTDVLVKIPKLSEQIRILEVSLASHRQERDGLRDSLLRLSQDEFEIERFKTRRDEAQKQIDNLTSEKGKLEEILQPAALDSSPTEAEQEQIQRTQEKLDSVDLDMNYWQQEFSYYESQISEKALEIERRKGQDSARINFLDGEIAKISQDIQQKQQNLEQLDEEKFQIEEKINELLIPDTAQNRFKLLIAMSFALLVGVVILGFFIVAFLDHNVRRGVFSSESGIQFLTLFSLVIAIILFGITGILEGKELAALLGGISGYILGRVTPTSSAAPPSAPTPPAATPPAATPATP